MAVHGICVSERTETTICMIIGIIGIIPWHQSEIQMNGHCIDKSWAVIAGEVEILKF